MYKYYIITICTITVILASPYETIVLGQTNLYVDDDAANDPGPGSTDISDAMEDGSIAHPFDAIQEAISAAIDGDTILVVDGLYRSDGNRDIQFFGKRIDLVSINGAVNCILDAEAAYADQHRLFELTPLDVQHVTINGFTLRGGYMYGDTEELQWGGAIYSAGSNIKISNCIMTDNFAMGGGAVACVNSSTTIENCTITSNYSAGGGGVLLVNDSSIVKSCRIENNTTSWNTTLSGHGGGVYIKDGNPTVSKCLISNNEAYSTGGGIYINGGNPDISECIIEKNDATGGGGIRADSSTASIRKCTIQSNQSRWNGGGIFLERAGVTVDQCTISDNFSSDEGGGVFVRYGSSHVIDACTIRRNRAHDGGGLYLESQGVKVLNCVISENEAINYGGAYRSINTFTNCTIVYNRAYNDVGGTSPLGGLFTNNIVWHNEPTNVNYPDSIMTLHVTYCNIGGGFLGEGNIDVEPAFAVGSDYHLAADSPCRDAGTNNPFGGISTTDIDGIDRIFPNPGTVDMGAYEFHSGMPTLALSDYEVEFFINEEDTNPQYQSVFVRNAGGSTLFWEIIEDCPWLSASPTLGQSSGQTDEIVLTAIAKGLTHGKYSCPLIVSGGAAHNGPRAIGVLLHVNKTLDVPSNYSTIQAAVDASVDGDVVLLANGTYQGVGNRNVNLNRRRITVRGEGGKDNCVIDCQQSGRAFFLENTLKPETVLEGLTIRNGQSNSDGGGAVKCSLSSMVIRNCLFDNNYCNHQNDDLSRRSHGGAIYIEAGRLQIDDTVLTNNRSRSNDDTGGSGGAIHLRGVLADLNRCTITNNVAFGDRRFGGDGGGIQALFSDVSLTQCIISENITSGYQASGGGVYVLKGSFSVHRSTISGNSAGAGGGAYINNIRYGRIFDSDIHNNISSNGGGGILINIGWFDISLLESYVIENSRITHNQAEKGGGIFMSQVNPNLVIRNMLIANNTASSQGGGISTYYGSPKIINSTIVANSAALAGGGLYVDRFYPYDEIPALMNSILWDNTAPLGSQLANVRGAILNVHHCDVEGGMQSVDQNCDGCEVIWDNSNLQSDPRFAGPEDFHLSPCSPCVDTGDSTLDVTNQVDIDGESRLFGEGIDIGADEFIGERPSDCRIPGDFDGDGLLTENDLPFFIECMSGPASTLPNQGCDPSDFLIGDMQDDGYVDLRDFAIWNNNFSN